MFTTKKHLTLPNFGFFQASSSPKAPGSAESSPTMTDKRTKTLEFCATHFSIKEEVQNATKTTTLDVSKSEFYVDGIRNHLIKTEDANGHSETLIAHDWVIKMAGEEEERKKELFFDAFVSIPQECQAIIYRCHQRDGFGQMLILPIQEMFKDAKQFFIRGNSGHGAVNKKEITYHIGTEKIIYVERQGISHYHAGDEDMIAISDAYIETTQVFNRHGEYAEPPKVILSLPAHILDQLKKTCAEKIKQHKALSGLEQSFYDAIMPQQKTSSVAPTPKASMISSLRRKAQSFLSEDRAPTSGLFSPKPHPSSISPPDMSSGGGLDREEMDPRPTQPSPEPKPMPLQGMYQGMY